LSLNVSIFDFFDDDLRLFRSIKYLRKSEYLYKIFGAFYCFSFSWSFFSTLQTFISGLSSSV